MKINKMIFWLFGAFISVVLLILIIGFFVSAPAYEGPESDHFNGTTFVNQNGARAKDFLEIIKWTVDREQGIWNEIPEDDSMYGPKPADRISDSVVVTYVNHATFLIQTDSLNILTDPVWSKRVSPFSFMGPKRMRQPGIRFDDLPNIDLVLISHNHYDHLDISTLQKINKKFSPSFITPLGVGQFLNKKGISKTKDLDWWMKDDISNSIQIVSVPAQHFSSRGLFDKDKTLWAGYVIKTEHGNVYFAGDTGYGEFLKEIGTKFSIKLGLIPIGAYKPRWVMSDIHLDPAEAIQAHKDINAQTSIATHFGTFSLADDGQYEPKDALEEILKLPENEQVDFRIMEEGKSIILK